MKLSLTRHVAGIGALVSALACGGPPAAVAGTAPLPLGPASPPPSPELPRAETGPPAPEDLALLVRVNDPERLAAEIVPFLPRGIASTITSYKQILELALGKRLADVVDLSQPLDTASVGNVPLFVVSFAVRPEAEARLGERLTLREEGGLMHVDGVTARNESSPLAACAFAAAAGRASLRLICASNQTALQSTARYLARTLAAEPFEAEVRVTIPGRLLRGKHDSTPDAFAAMTTKAIADATRGRLGTDLVERFVEEIDRVDLDLAWAPTGVVGKVDLRLSRRDSMLARLLVPQSKPMPPPRAFFRLPADSLLALHTTGALPEDIAGLRAALGDSIESTLVQDGYQPAAARTLREQLSALFLTGGPLVVGTGVAGGRDGAERAFDRFGSARARSVEETTAETQLRAALTPWFIAEVDEAPGPWTGGLRDLMRSAAEAERTRATGSKASTARDPDGNHVDMRAGTLDPAWQLPKDTLHVEVLVSARTRAKRPARTGHLFAVPKGGTTWLGYSEDVAAITARLRAAIDDTTDVGTLASSAAATTLRSAPALAAGIGWGPFSGWLGARTASYEELRGMARTSARISTLGSRHELVAWTVFADASPGTVHVGLQVKVSRQIALDLAPMLGF